jgi:hypothetical protein
VWEEVGRLTKGFDVTAFADAWTKQAGFPVVHVQKIKPGLFLLSQERYFSSGHHGQENNQTWLVDGFLIILIYRPIPLFADLTAHQEDSVMYDNTTFVQLPTDDQLVLNRERQGFYRVLYDDAGYQFMRTALHTRTHLSGIDRAAFLYDMNAFAKSGHMSSVKVLELVKGIDVAEDSPSVWAAAVAFLSSVELLVSADDATHRDLEGFVRRILTPLVARIGSGKGAVQEKLLLVTLPLAGKVGVPQVVDYSIKKLRRLRTAEDVEESGLNLELLQVVVNTVSSRHAAINLG